MVGREGGEREGKEGKGWLRGTKRKYLKGYSGGQTAGGVGGQNFLGFGASLYLTFSLTLNIHTSRKQDLFLDAEYLNN